MLDFKRIAETPIIDVAKMLEIALTPKGEQLVGNCPISKLNNATAFKITPAINRFVCFCSACKKLDKQGGDVIELVRRVKGLQGPREAAELIASTMGTPRAEAPKEAKEKGFDPEAYLATLDTASDQLQHLAVSPETLRAFKAGYCGRGIYRGKLAVAVCDPDGKIKAFVGVSLFETNDLLFPKDYKPPYFMGCQLVEEGELHIFDNVKDALLGYENGVRSILILLHPITADVLKSLYLLMETSKSTTLSICF